MYKENILEQFEATHSPEFRDLAILVCKDLGISEDEAELLVDDYIGIDEIIY